MILRSVVLVVALADTASSAARSEDTTGSARHRHAQVANDVVRDGDFEEYELMQAESSPPSLTLDALPSSVIPGLGDFQVPSRRELRALESKFTCGWETEDECGWYSTDAGTSVWTRKSGTTNTNGGSKTGPSSAASGTFYIYSECQSNGGNTFTYQLDLGSRLSLTTVSFQYYLFGSGIQDVQFLYSVDDLSWTPLWQKNAQMQSSSTEPWQAATLDVSGIYPQFFRFSTAQSTGDNNRDAAFDTFSLQFSPSPIPTLAVLSPKPSPEPTFAPSLVPSLGPTPSPTLPPTPVPTQIPSFSPTFHPSFVPLSLPTLSP